MYANARREQTLTTTSSHCVMEKLRGTSKLVKPYFGSSKNMTFSCAGGNVQRGEQTTAHLKGDGNPIGFPFTNRFLICGS